MLILTYLPFAFTSISSLRFFPAAAISFQFSASSETCTVAEDGRPSQFRTTLSNLAFLPRSTYSHSSRLPTLIQVLLKFFDGTRLTSSPSLYMSRFEAIHCSAPFMFRSTLSMVYSSASGSLASISKRRVGSSWLPSASALSGSVCWRGLDSLPMNSRPLMVWSTVHSLPSFDADTLTSWLPSAAPS